MHDPRLDELLQNWSREHEQGRNLTAAELCRDCPELAEELARRIEVLRRFERLAAPASVAAGDSVSTNDETLKFNAPGPRSPEPRSDARYRILRPHAKGGLGEVFLAMDEELGREVALKEIQERHAGDADNRARFVLEAEITGGLEHPGIVPVYGLGAYADGRPFYAMRFIQGESLAAAIKRFHETNPKTSDPAECDRHLRQLLRRFFDVCNAIGYAHSRGVLHRDIKPSNIMLGDYGETLVVDWGIAKAGVTNQTRGEPAASAAGVSAKHLLTPRSASDSSATSVGSALGTPVFMSPEQADGRNDELGPATDVYSLGATLYCLLTGQTPFSDKNLSDLLGKVAKGDFARPRQVKPDVPLALEAVCVKAMALKRSDRYASALALASDIDHWLADEPVSAYGEPWPVRAGRWARKHKPVVATAATLLLTATLGLAIGLYFVNAERNRTELARQGEATQKLAAQVAEQKAKDEAELATAVKDFLTFDLLRLASAREQHREERRGTLMADPDLKVRDLVLRAAEKIEGRFRDSNSR